ncbi:MAG: hypothetical protein ISR85_06750 [Kiritimatiellales bacterium]|nr:hypothetical protein [Kiritimatiellota bacterium]MBL7012609.1 hypothetical protein [Kiritimatiellales bacterium]
MNRFSVLPKWVILLFFWIGLTAAVCIRSLTLVAHYSPAASVWLWRFAMLCYTFFFGYRYLIGRRRRNIVHSNKLIDEVEKAEEFDPATRQAMLYVLNSIMRSKELFNYAFICILSVVALLLDFLLT